MSYYKLVLNKQKKDHLGQCVIRLRRKEKRQAHIQDNQR